MFVLPEGLPLELTPLAFLAGKWSGSGVISYSKPGSDEPPVEHEFLQTVEFSYTDANYLNYVSQVRLADGTELSDLDHRHLAPLGRAQKRLAKAAKRAK